MGCESSKQGKQQRRPVAEAQCQPAEPQQAAHEEEKHAVMMPRTEPICASTGDLEFMEVPVGKHGGLCLTHFPGRKSMYKLKEAGCDVVVTLQKDSEGAQKVKELCNTFRVHWMQVDFWQLYHKKEVGVLHSHIAEVAAYVKAGHKVMIHCAAGIHRTGMFAYAVLRELDFTPEAASSSLRSLREVTFRKVGRHRILSVEELLGAEFPFSVHLEGSEDYLPPDVEHVLPPAA